MKSFLSLALLAICLVASAQSDKDLVIESVQLNEAKAQLSFLASDELKGRDTPSDGQEAAARFIATQLAMYGVKPFDSNPDYTQRVPFVKVKPPSGGAIVTGDQSFAYADDFLQLSGGNMDWNGEIVVLKYATEEELKMAKVKGKMVVAMCGDGSVQSPQQLFGATTAKRAAAKEAGAAGLIEIYNSPQLPWKILVQYLDKDKVQLDKGEPSDDFPSFWLNDDNRSAMIAFEKVTKVGVSVEGADKNAFTAPNVFGFVEGSDPKLKEEFVVHCAHFDHVGIGTPDAKGDSIYNGTRDNGIGTVAVLQAAKNLAKNPTKRSALFVLFTAEEKGLLGSEYFVDNSPLPVNQMVYCNNVDNGGYNDTSKVTVIGLSRTTAKENIEKAVTAFGLEVIDDPAPEQGLFDRSDNVQFAKMGVPAPDFSLGFTSFDKEIMKYYHQAGDHVESLDMSYIHKYWSAYVLTGRLIGNDPKKPFWTEGDKYYEAGVKLYE